MVEAHDPYLYLTDSYSQDTGELEAYFVRQSFEGGRIIPSGVMRYAALPPVLQAKGIEQCVNHYADLTNRGFDPQERGGWAHIQSKLRKLFYPIKPSVGSSGVKDGVVSYRVTPDMFVTDNFYPLVFIHGHLGNDTLSATDISLVVGSHQEVNALACIAGATKFNYLLLSTQETFTESPAELTERFVAMYPRLLEEGISFRERGLDIVFGDEKGKATDLVMDVFSGDPQNYYADLALVQEAAEYYKFGFYISKRDGIYTLQTRQSIVLLVESLLDEATALM